MESIGNDIRFALRTMRRAPAFTAVAVLILTLGMGATTAIFAVVQAVLLRPLPYSDPERLVALSRTLGERAGRALPTVSLAEVEAWRRESRALASIGSFVFTQLPVSIGTESLSVVSGAVDPELLSTLGTAMAVGSNFSGTGSSRPDMSAIISHPIWTGAFHSDPAIIGRTMLIDGALYTVVGVLPAKFQFPRADASYFTDDVGLLIPVANIVKAWGRDSSQWFAIGRLANGASLEQARTEMNTISAALARERPQERGVSVHLATLHEETTRHVRPALTLTMGISVVLLLIACTNIMNLLFSRSVVRGREMAIRKAVGASTGRLVRQMLTESACLTFIAGAAGLLLARLLLDALVGLSPFHLPVTGTIHVDFAVVAFAFATCALAAVAAGIFPAIHAGRRREDLVGGAGTRTSGGRRLAEVQRALTIAQVALGLALLTTSALLVHSLWRLSAVDPGFRRDGVFGFSLSVPSDHTGPQKVRLYARMLDAIRTIPGVRSAGWITLLPPESRKGIFVPFTIEGRPAPSTPAERLFCNFQVTSEDYFQTVGIPLVRGRAFTAADDEAAPPVAIVNETLARRDFPNIDPVGQKLSTMFDGRPREIVGVIKTIHDRGLATSTVATTYVPFRQSGVPYGSIAVRADIPAQSVIPEIRRRLNAIDPTIPLADFQTLDARVYKSLDEPRFYTLMAALCASMAVLFVTLGLYGVVTHAVARRTAEIGIRMALGAQAGTILSMVLRQGLALVAIGIAAGTLLSIFVTKIFSSLLFEVTPTDPATFAAAAGIIAAVTLAASYVPAWRASRVSPIVALRDE
jgi:putative ABC transport system permease protein